MHFSLYFKNHIVTYRNTIEFTSHYLLNVFTWISTLISIVFLVNSPQGLPIFIIHFLTFWYKASTSNVSSLDTFDVPSLSQFYKEKEVSLTSFDDDEDISHVTHGHAYSPTLGHFRGHWCSDVVWSLTVDLTFLNPGKLECSIVTKN